MAARSLAPRRARAAAERGETVLAGPWLSEVGFEVLCWIPMLRRFLRENAIPRDRAVAFTRGGAGAWYADMCHRSVDVLALLSPGELRAGQERRVAELGVQKQIALTGFERELLERAGVEHGALVHPGLMYTSWQAYWSGRRSLDWVLGHGDFGRLPEPPPLRHELPQEYVAVKAYFSDAFPATDANRTYVRDLIVRLAELGPVVLLDLPFSVDDHEAAGISEHPNVIHAGAWMSPTDNLAVQSAIVAGARHLHATYGGFAYLGPFLGVDTTSFLNGPHNPRHLELMHAVQGDLGATLDARRV